MILLPLLLACADDDDTGGPLDAGPACWTDLAPGAQVPLAGGFSEGTEGLAFVQGRLFVTTSTAVVEVLPDGGTAVLAPVDAALGLAPQGEGLLLADPGVFSMGGDTDGRVWSVDLDGALTLVSEGWSNPNFLAPTPWGTVLMADDTEDGLVEIDLATGEGTARLPEVPSPNGMVLLEDRLVVASTFVADAPVWAAPVAGGELGPAAVLAHTVSGGANDGMAEGPGGAVYVAVNLAGEIWRVAPDGTAGPVAQGLDTPASLALGAGEGFDPCSLYVTSLLGEEVVRVAVGEGI